MTFQEFLMWMSEGDRALLMVEVSEGSFKPIKLTLRHRHPDKSVCYVTREVTTRDLSFGQGNLLCQRVCEMAEELQKKILQEQGNA